MKKTLQPIFYSPYFIAYQLTPALLILATLLFKRHQSKLKNDTEYVRKRKTNTEIEKHLNTIEQAALKKDTLNYYTAIQKLIQTRLQQNKTEASTWQEIESTLIQKHTPKKLILQLKIIHETADTIRFSGIPQSETLKKENYEAFKKLYSQLEDHIK